MNRRAVLVLPAVALLAAYFASRPTAAKDSPEAAECRWTDTPIVLDGSDDEDAWKTAQVIDHFAMPWQKETTPRGKTTAKLLWDRDFLYFHADMEDADLFADIEEHDGMLWMNDAFELFFRPAADKPGYFEFEVAPNGAVFDAFFPKVDIPTIAKQMKEGTFNVEVKAKLRGTLNKRDDKDKGWSVEGRIPWADFLRAGGRPEPGEEWRFMLARCNDDKGRDDEVSSTAPIKEKRLSAFFHQVEDYPAIKFVGPPPAKRERLVTSKVVGSPEPPLPYRARRLYPNYTPTYPIMAKAIPGTDQLLVIHEDRPWGVTTLSRLPDDPGSKTADAVKLLDTPGSGTVYDVAFHPKFAENRYLYVGWNGDHKAGVKKKKASRVTRYTVKPGPPLTIDESSAKTIIEWESDGHNGAAVCFGVDGMMYVTSGDGTSDSDVDEMGQRTDNLLSKVLRIDVDKPDGGKEYSVPKDNPYVDDKRFAPETWAYGLRNPWRIACDEKTGHIWVGNNGQDLWEQAYFVRKGENYGWSVTEGSAPFYPHRKAGPTPIVKPTIEHHHAEFRSLTGGLVLHGKQLPDLDGAYLYGDYSTGRIWAMKHDGTKPLWHKEIASPRIQITAFGLNTKGELIVCDHSPAGGLYTLEPTPKDAPTTPFPRKLSESGLFTSVKDHTMAAGVVPYSVNAPFWSDGLHKERWIAVPGDGTIEFTKTRGWNFPDQTVIVKSFANEQVAGDASTRKWVETRFFTKQKGEWVGYSYAWNDAGTDADLVPAAGMDRTLKSDKGEQVWHYPSRFECMVCHSRAANFVLGLCTPQMNKGDQLQSLERSGLLSTGFDWQAQARDDLAERAKSTKENADAHAKVHGQQPGQREPRKATLLPTQPDRQDRLVDPYDDKEDLTKRAKSWLHANCASCHVEAGGGNARMELEWHTPLDKMRIVDERPIHTHLGLADARLVAPGAPERSVLLKRTEIRGPNQMPNVSTHRPDDRGVRLLEDWIRSLSSK